MSDHQNSYLGWKSWYLWGVFGVSWIHMQCEVWCVPLFYIEWITQKLRDYDKSGIEFWGVCAHRWYWPIVKVGGFRYVKTVQDFMFILWWRTIHFVFCDDLDSNSRPGVCTAIEAQTRWVVQALWASCLFKYNIFMSLTLYEFSNDVLFYNL